MPPLFKTLKTKKQTMKITITLLDAEVKGIKKYLKEVDEICRPSNKNVKFEIQNLISSYLQCSKDKISDYINEELNKNN